MPAQSRHASTARLWTGRARWWTPRRLSTDPCPSRCLSATHGATTPARAVARRGQANAPGGPRAQRRRWLVRGAERRGVQIAEVQALHFDASTAFDSLQKGQVLEGADGAAGASLISSRPIQKTTKATMTKAMTRLMKLPQRIATSAA